MDQRREASAGPRALVLLTERGEEHMNQSSVLRAAVKNAITHKARAVSAICILIGLVITAAGCASTDTGDTISGASPVEEIDAYIGDAIEPLSGNEQVLIVYFSQGESTRQVAHDLATVTDGDIEVIEEKRERRGFCGYMRAGGASSFKIASRILPGKCNPADYDIVYVCTPVWAWNLSPPVRAWLKANRGNIRKAGFVTVSGDTEPDKIARDMERTSGVDPFVVIGFSEQDFYAENRNQYETKIAALIEPLR